MKAKKVKAKIASPAQQQYKILLVSGGTGGHSFPALAVARLLAKHGHAPSILCEQRGFEYFQQAMDQEKLNCPIYCLPLKNPQGGKVKKIISALSLLTSILPAGKLLRRERPDILLGFGGYMMIPSFLVARLGRVPHIFLEQNAVMGRANRLFKSSAAAIATGLPTCRGLSKQEKAKTHFVGTPIKQEFLQAGEGAGHKTSKKNITILVTGGSQGAKVFADIVPRAIEKLLKKLDGTAINIHIQQQCKAEQIKDLAIAYNNLGVKHDIKDFFYDVPQKLAAADIFIGRAGASTIAEVASMAKPSILIPFPFATDNHQYYNARLLADKKACRLLSEKKNKTPADNEQLSEALADELFDLILNPKHRQQLASNIKNFAQKNAGAELMKLAISVAKQHKKRA